MIDGDVVFYSTCVIGIIVYHTVSLTIAMHCASSSTHCVHSTHRSASTRRRCFVQIFVLITAQLHQFFIIIVQMWLYRFAFVDPHAVCIRECYHCGCGSVELAF